MADPLSMAVATAVAGKAAETLICQASQTIAAIRRKVQERFRGVPSSADELAHALNAEFAADPASATRSARCGCRPPRCHR